MKTLVITFLLLSNLFGQGWDFSGNFPNDNFKGGSGLQGMAVDPEGKVWITKYSREYYTIPGTTDSLFLRLIYVFNSDGSSASFSPIWKLAGPGFVDTLLESNNRGLRADQNGNIIYVSGNQIMYRINYLNGEGMNKVFLDLGTSPTAPAITASGKIFVGPVVNTNGPLKEFDSNFNFISNAVTFTQTDFTRSIEVDLDFGNNKIFFPAALNRKMIIVYQRPNELAPFDSVGTILDGISCESISFNKVSRKLWVSGGSYQSLPAPNSSYSPNVWYEYDIMSNSILDSIVWQMNFPNNINERPRAIDFSPDGNIAYVGCFGSSDYAMVQKFTRIVLPVELLSFEYFIDKQNIHLKWITSSELNNGGFQLERKQINTWQSIGFVQGNGTTTETKVYSFIDTPSKTGKYQYRLKQIDFDGSFEYSKPIEVEFAMPDNYVLSQNYPNPFNPVTTISWYVPIDGNQSLTIYDVLGNQVLKLFDEFRTAGDYKLELNSAGLTSGIYYYQLKAGSFIDTKKMILLK